MKREFVAVLMATLGLSACGITGKLDAVSKLEASRASYRQCLAQRDNATNCELQKARYQTDIMEAGRTRGTLTDWRWL
jgi:hypothetical protein